MTTPRYTRDDVIEAAGRLFAERGYHGTSMRDLGKALGLHGSSLYSHVTSKAALLVAVVERGAGLFAAAAEAAMAADLEPSERLRALIRGHIDVVLDHSDETRTFLNEASALDRAHRRKVVEYRDAYEAAFRSTIAAAVDEGAFRADTDVPLASIFTLSILNAVDRWYDDRGRIDREQLADAIHAAVVTGLAA